MPLDSLVSSPCQGASRQPIPCPHTCLLMQAQPGGGGERRESGSEQFRGRGSWAPKSSTSALDASLGSCSCGTAMVTLSASGPASPPPPCSCFPPCPSNTSKRGPHPCRCPSIPSTLGKAQTPPPPLPAWWGASHLFPLLHAVTRLGRGRMQQHGQGFILSPPPQCDAGCQVLQEQRAGAGGESPPRPATTPPFPGPKAVPGSQVGTTAGGGAALEHGQTHLWVQT